MQSGHAEFSQGYHQGPYAYTTPALSSVASNAGHDINKPVAAAQQGMYSSAGVPAPAQHRQSMGGPIASSQPIIQQGQQMSRNPTIAMPTAYYPRNNVPPRTMQSMARNPISAVVNQPGQQPSSQYAPIPAMVPIQHNFNSFPPLVNHQFQQMYQHRAYNPPQYPVIPSQQYLWNYNTPPDQNSNGYFPSYGMSSYQSMPPQMPPQSIPAQPQQQHSRKGEKPIPLIDPKTGKNVLSVDKHVEDSSCPKSEKESETSDSNICVQFATQVAAFLNDSRSHIASKQPEDVRETSVSDTEESLKSEKLNSPSNIAKVVDFSETKKTNNLKLVMESNCSYSTQEAVQPIVASEEELVQPSNSENSDSSSAVSTKIPEKVLDEGKKKKDKKNRGEIKKGEDMDAFLDSKEDSTIFKLPPPPPVTLAASIFVPVEINSSLVPITDSEISNAVRLPKNTTPQNGRLSSELTSKTAFESSNASTKKKEPHTVVKRKQNKIVLKYSYKRDQWSPLNPEGKKQYDREFLLQLQSHPISLRKPSNLPNLDVIKNKARIQKLPEANNVPPPLLRIPGKRQKKEKEKSKKDTGIPNQNKELHKSKNPWRPLHKIEVSLIENDKLKRSVLGVLNKLTPQKFETLLSQLKDLNIDTEEKLALVCHLIFETAINERKFSAVYAKLCKHLALIKVPASGTTDGVINFRKLLLAKCLEEFELGKYDELKNEEMMNTLETAGSHKRKEFQLEYEEKERKIRNKRLGNIRFIAELFKLGMLIEPIMHEVIKELLSQGDEKSLECLSEFLKTIGKELDDKGTTKNPYGKQNNWVPRREENYPKTLDEIREEAEREVCEQQQLCNDKTNYPKTIPEGSGQQKNADLGVYSSDYNEDGLERKSNSLRDKFRGNIDFEEAIGCVIEMASPNTVHMFINAAINEVLERSSQDRFSLGELLSSLLKKKSITFDQYKKGFAGVLEIIDDYSLDIPLIWDYMGEILEPIIENIETPFKLLKDVLQPCIPSEKAGMLVSSILHCATKRKGTKKLGEVWKESGIQWPDIIGTDRNVADFIKKHKLEFTVSPTMDNPPTRIPLEDMGGMKKHLLSLLEKNSEFEEVFDWVNANVSDTSNTTFIRTLVTAVHESCLSGSGTTWELNTSKLTSRIPLISLYVSPNEKLQLQALYAIQALVNRLGQPSGLLHQIFDLLYDDDVISEESFIEWEQSDDPNEAEGKFAAVLSVKSFFTSL